MKRQRTQNSEKTSISYSEDHGFLGHLLYSERLNKGISLETVALELNLSSYIIKNLETGYLSRPPGLSYMLGFLRTYASYLELDGKELTSYVTSTGETFFEEESILKIPFQQKQLPTRPILWGSVLALSLVIAGYIWLKSYTKPTFRLNSIAFSYNDTISDTSETNNGSNEGTSHSINRFLKIYHNPFVVPAQPSSPSTFQICCSIDTWIALKDSKGNLVREGLLHKGDNIQLPLDFEGVLHTGNAGGIYVKYGTQNSSVLGRSGQVIQNFHINLKKILQNPLNPVNN